MNELLARFIDDRCALTGTELGMLAQDLESHPEAIEEMRAQLVCDELLSRRFNEERAVFVAQVKQAATELEGGPADVPIAARSGFVASVKRRLGLEKLRRPFLRWALAGGAACALAAALFFMRDPKVQVRLAATSGDVRVWREQKTMAGKPRLVLQAGDWLLTGRDGAAEIEFPGETTRLAIGADAEFGVVTAMPDKQLKLTAGTLRASVARQSASHPMLIRTPTAKAEVLGTKFEMSATKERTEMTVTEGRVLIARTEDESGVVVETSQSATVTEQEPVMVKTPPVAQALDTGLLARWTFDEGEGLVAADASGHGRNLTLSADGAWGEGHAGKALDLHATKADVESPRLALPNVFTIALWLRIQPGGPARPQPLLGCRGGAGGMEEFWLNMPPTFPGSGIVLDVPGRTMGSQAHTKAGVILAGRWHHLVVSVDSAQGRADFFVDGRDVTEAGGLRRDFKLGGPMLIGRRVKGGPLPFDGQLDDLRIYGRALTAAEIAALAGGKETAE